MNPNAMADAFRPIPESNKVEEENKFTKEVFELSPKEIGTMSPNEIGAMPPIDAERAFNNSITNPDHQDKVKSFEKNFKDKPKEVKKIFTQRIEEGITTAAPETPDVSEEKKTE
jgi:hypothetical protein